MAIWTRTPDLKAIQRLSAGCLNGHVGIQFLEFGEDYLEASMPVDQRTHQPFGLLHGGASVVLSESVCSTAGAHCVAHESDRVLGLEINANHVRGIREGLVIGRAEPVHVGRSTQVWQCRIRDERGRLICASRMTLAVVSTSRSP